MATKEDLKPEGTGDAGADPPVPPDESGAAELGVEAFDADAASSELEALEGHIPSAPVQLGTGRFVYAAYFAGAIAIAFIVSKVLDFAWFKLQNVKPVLGEPRDEIVMPFAALVGALVAVYCWYRTRTRTLAEEVATEMSKVTWPSRDEVTGGTFVVIITTVVSTVFFALMDKFWGFVSNLVYGGS